MAVLALSDQLSLPILYVAAFALGIGETLFDTAAQSIMPNIVAKDLLSRANSRLYAVELTHERLRGAAARWLPGGHLRAHRARWQRHRLRPRRVRPDAHRGLVQARTGRAQRARCSARSGEGFDFLWHNPVLRPLAIMVAASNLANSAVVAVFVLFAVAPGPMGLDEVGYGLLITAMAVGGIAGSVIEERVERRSDGPTCSSSVVVVVGAAMLIPALTAQRAAGRGRHDRAWVPRS